MTSSWWVSAVWEAATTYHLAHAGARVLGVEQFALGHDRGASHDTSRILRHKSPPAGLRRPDEAGVRRLGRAREASGQRLVTGTGGIDLCPAVSDLSLGVYAASLTGAGIPYGLLDGREIQARWPQVRVEESTAGLYQERTGIVPAGRTTAMLHGLAASSGAVLVDRTPVIDQSEHPEAEVVTSWRTFAAHSVVVCADAWTAGLVAPLGWAPRLTVLDQQVTYFQPGRPERVRARQVPGVDLDRRSGLLRIPLLRRTDDQGCTGLRRARRRTGQAHPRDRERRAHAPLADHGRGVPGSGRAVRSERCLYSSQPTMTSLAAGPGLAAVQVALGAGHAFKPWTKGRLLAAMALGQHDRTAEWVQSFSPERPALTDPDYPIQWMGVTAAPGHGARGRTRANSATKTDAATVTRNAARAPCWSATMPASAAPGA